jgi:hypothetical protein
MPSHLSLHPPTHRFSLPICFYFRFSISRICPFRANVSHLAATIPWQCYVRCCGLVLGRERSWRRSLHQQLAAVHILHVHMSIHILKVKSMLLTLRTSIYVHGCLLFTKKCMILWAFPSDSSPIFSGSKPIATFQNAYNKFCMNGRRRKATLGSFLLECHSHQGQDWTFLHLSGKSNRAYVIHYMVVCSACS